MKLLSSCLFATLLAAPAALAQRADSPRPTKPVPPVAKTTPRAPAPAVVAVNVQDKAERLQDEARKLMKDLAKSIAKDSANLSKLGARLDRDLAQIGKRIEADLATDLQKLGDHLDVLVRDVEVKGKDIQDHIATGIASTKSVRPQSSSSQDLKTKRAMKHLRAAEAALQKAMRELSGRTTRTDRARDRRETPAPEEVEAVRRNVERTRRRTAEIARRRAVERERQKRDREYAERNRKYAERDKIYAERARARAAQDRARAERDRKRSAERDAKRHESHIKLNKMRQELDRKRAGYEKEIRALRRKLESTESKLRRKPGTIATDTGALQAAQDVRDELRARLKVAEVGRVMLEAKYADAARQLRVAPAPKPMAGTTVRAPRASGAHTHPDLWSELESLRREVDRVRAEMNRLRKSTDARRRKVN